MGYPSSDIPESHSPASPVPSGEAFSVPPPLGHARRPERIWRHLILFVLTCVTTTYAGEIHYASFTIGFTDHTLTLSGWPLFAQGLWYSVSILAILGAHEFGHYGACRYYGVDASLPYFLPAPLPLTGTLGAFIRIRQPIRSKRELFDIGIAGPIAGFVVAVPVLLVGMYLSKVIQVPTDFEGSVLEIGEPLLFKAAAWLTFGSLPEGYTVNMHPMAFAAWFGMLATALNLFPISQLDGGHICYAVLGRKSTLVTLFMIVFLIGLSFISTSWIVWTVLTLGMLLVLGPRHPRVFDEDIPLDTTRLWLAAFALLMFVLCFTHSPIEAMDIVRSG